MKQGGPQTSSPYLVHPSPSRVGVYKVSVCLIEMIALFSPSAWITSATCCLVLSWYAGKEN